MSFYGKLSQNGVLSDISNRPPRTWGDGSQDVPVATMPKVLGPFGYDQAKGDWIQLLSTVQNNIIAEFQIQVDTMIEQHYNQKTLDNLQVLYTEALFYKYVNRLAYLKPVRDWKIAIAAAVTAASQKVMTAIDIATAQAVVLTLPTSPAQVDQVVAAKMLN